MRRKMNMLDHCVESSNKHPPVKQRRPKRLLTAPDEWYPFTEKWTADAWGNLLIALLHPQSYLCHASTLFHYNRWITYSSMALQREQPLNHFCQALCGILRASALRSSHAKMVAIDVKIWDFDHLTMDPRGSTWTIFSFSFSHFGLVSSFCINFCEVCDRAKETQNAAQNVKIRALCMLIFITSCRAKRGVTFTTLETFSVLSWLWMLFQLLDQ